MSIYTGEPIAADYFSQADWQDWRWQMKNRIKSAEDLQDYVTLTPEENKSIHYFPV